MGEEVAVDEVEALRLGEGECGSGEAAVGEHDEDVAAVNLAAGPVEDLEVRGADCGPLPAGLAVLALDHPAAAVGVGGFDVRAVVAPAADLLRVGAAVAVHEVPYGELEVIVVEAVEVFDGVAQALGPDLVPSRGLPAPAHPQCARGTGCEEAEYQDPGMGSEPRHHCHDETEGHEADQADEPQLLRAAGLPAPRCAGAPAPLRGWAGAHLPVPVLGKTIG